MRGLNDIHKVERQISDNSAKLNSCALPHAFVAVGPTATCSHCGGWLSRESAFMYMLGVNDATRHLTHTVPS